MIDHSTLNRIERVKQLLRDERRSELVAAEKVLTDAHSALRSQRAEHGHATRAFATLGAVAPAELELMASRVVESGLAAARALRTVEERDAARRQATAARIEAERDVRGVALAKARILRHVRQRAERAETQLAELRSGRSR